MTKEERAEYMKRYRAEHQEEIKANRRYYYITHKEATAQYNRDYYQRAKNNLACKAYHEKNKDDSEYKRKKNENTKRWIEKNRDKWNAYQRERYWKKKEQI